MSQPAKIAHAAPWNVLVFPAASEVGLEVFRSLRNLKEVVLHGANAPAPNVAESHFERMHPLPAIWDGDCLPKLKALIAEQSIDAIFPGGDDVALWLAEKQGELGIPVIGSSFKTCQICRSKKLTYEALRGKVSLPAIWNDAVDQAVFPVFVKPECGNNSIRARRIDNAQELKTSLQAEPDLLVLENLPGREYTVDCFSDRHGNVLFARARERVVTKGGIATVTRHADLPEALDWAKKIAAAIPMRGVWFFQIKEDKAGHLKLMEAAPRIAGSMALNRFTGVNFALLSLFDAAEYPVSVNASTDQLTLMRSLDTRIRLARPIGVLYLDFDDVLIVRGKVNAGIVALAYECRNKGIPVRLITRHKGDLKAALDKYRLGELFDDIVHLIATEDTKAAHITEADAVFVDDSHGERVAVSRANPQARCLDPATALGLYQDMD